MTSKKPIIHTQRSKTTSEAFQKEVTYQFTIWVDTARERLGEPVQSYRVEDVLGAWSGVCPFDELLADPVLVMSATITMAFTTVVTGVYLPGEEGQGARRERETNGCRPGTVLS